MPRDRDLKRIIRARMQKTGESYTTARSHIIDKPAETEAPPDHAALAGMRDDTVAEKTGRTWAAWVEELDRHGAHERSHREIAKLVGDAYDIPGWWAQTVTVGYERIKGLREKGQRRDGHYEVNRSRTFAVAVEDLFRAWSEPARRRRWLKDAKPRRRTAIPEKSLRLSWPDGTTVLAYFEAKGDAKSTVSVQHTGLPGRERADEMKAYWSDQLENLGAYLRG